MPLPDYYGPLADLEGAYIIIEFNCSAFLIPLALTGKDIPGRRLRVPVISGIAGVASCLPVTTRSTSSCTLKLI